MTVEPVTYVIIPPDHGPEPGVYVLAIELAAILRRLNPPAEKLAAELEAVAAAADAGDLRPLT